MKKILVIIAMLCTAVVASAQIPYFSGTIGDGKTYTYTSLKFRPGANIQETYSTIQRGFGDHIAIGTDLYTYNSSVYFGYTFRFNAFKSKYFGIGGQLTPSFDLGDNHKFSYFTGALYMNGAITDNGNLFWVSNTWFGVNRGAPTTYNQWWYLGYYIPTKNPDFSITPMVGLIHSWLFDSKVNPAVGAYFTIKNCDLYVWADRFIDEHPRIVFGMDFAF